MNFVYFIVHFVLMITVEISFLSWKLLLLHIDRDEMIFYGHFYVDEFVSHITLYSVDLNACILCLHFS